ncbi:hypothetical protein, partial [Neisseria gonorrhoeae]|uniref:hypothetical protein n=1 Tax=Neisseria gonorrhoeae TaxID=485 RepID=UPI001C98F7AE
RKIGRKKGKGGIRKDWVRYPIFTNTPLFLFYELFFNTANPLTKRFRTEIRPKKNSHSSS